MLTMALMTFGRQSTKFWSGGTDLRRRFFTIAKKWCVAKIFDGGYICHQIGPPQSYLRWHIFFACPLVRTMVYGDHQVKNNHPSPSWSSNIILTRWTIAKNYCALLMSCCSLYVVLSCGSVSFESKQVVKALLIFHRPAAEGLGWWWGEENEFLQHFYASILQKRAIYIQNCPPMCHKTCLCPDLSNPPAALYPSSK